MKYSFMLGLRILSCILVFQSSLSPAASAQTEWQQYIDSARKNSPLINDYRNQIKASAYELQRLKAIYTGGNLDLNGNFLFAPILSTDNHHTSLDLNSHGATNYYGFELGQTNGGLYQGLVTYTQPLFGDSRYQIAAKQVEIGRQINEQAIRLSAHDLEKLVTDQYILCLLDKKQMIFADSLLSLLQEQLSLVKKLAAASLLQQSDLTLLHVEYENDQNILATYKASYYSKLMDLNLLCGIRDTSYRLLPDIHLELNQPLSSGDQLPASPGSSQVRPDQPQGSTDQARGSSPYLEKFRLDSLNLTAAQSVSELKYKPTLNFVTNAGLDATYVSTAANRFGFTAGLNFTWNLFDGHQRKSFREKTQILQMTNSFYRDNFTRQNEVRKHKFLTDLSAYKERRTYYQQQTDEYTQVLKDYKKEILQGQLSIINYITVLKNMVLLRRDFLIAETNSLLLINGYNYWNW